MITKIPVEIYDTDVYILKGETSESFLNFVRSGEVVCSEDDIKEGCDTFDCWNGQAASLVTKRTLGGTILTKDGKIIVLLPSKVEEEIVVHELFHAVANILSPRGVDFMHDDEAGAWLIWYLYKKYLERLKEATEGVSLNIEDSLASQSK